MTAYIDGWFPTLVCYSDLNCMDEIEEIKSVSLKLLKDIEFDPHPFGESKLTTSFWHKEHGHLYKDPRFTKLCSAVRQQAIILGEALGYSSLGEDQLTFLNMWVNCIGPHDYHAQHIHSTTGRAAFSGVFYVDAPSGAKLSFGSPLRDNYEPVKPWNDTPGSFSKVSYDCIPGRIVIFKSNVYHGYDAHGQDQSKISIPFNIAIDERKS